MLSAGSAFTKRHINPFAYGASSPLRGLLCHLPTKSLPKSY